jgi:hypothetical protein
MEAMSVTEAENAHPLLAEDAGVYLWRFQRSLEMGFGWSMADRIAITQIDLHELERLLSFGCPRQTAYRILRQ